MKNLLYLAAIAATTVGITSCSSDEDLNNAVKDSGVPFKVTATAPTTRATDATDANFANFQLYAFEGANEWIAGKQFTKTTSWAPANAKETYNWPNAGVTSNFYAVSENGTSMSSAFTVDDIANTQSFTYTVPTTVADQKDLLVASTTGKSTDAKVALAFKHALAAAKLKFTITPTYTAYDPNTYPTFRLRAEIKSITFNNIYSTGTYNFTGNSWGNLSNRNSYKITFTTPIVIDTKITEQKTIPIDIANIESIMFIPQTIDINSYWDIKPVSAGKGSVLTEPTDKIYISMEAQTMMYDATGTGDAANSVTKALNYEMTSSDLNPLNPLNITKVEGNADTEKNGYFDNNHVKIATLEGEIKDVSPTSVINDENINTNYYFSSGVDITYITYNTEKSPGQNFADHDEAGYNTILKPLCLASYSATETKGLEITYSPLTLSNLKNHIFNIELGACVNKQNAEGAFGTLVKGGAAKHN